MSEASPTMNNSVEQYGVEMEFGTELKQAVSDEDGTRIVTYKPFIKDGEVTIYPVNDSGQIIEGGKPIFQDGRWQNLTEPKYKSNRTSTYQTNTTISGIGFIDTDGDGETGVGDTIVYTITVANTSSDVLQNLTFAETLKDALGNSLTMTTGPSFVSATASSSVGNLIVGETATYSATYLITQSDVDSGGVENTVTFTGNSARNPDMSEKDVKDVSDNGNDADGNTVNDPTITRFEMIPSLEAVSYTHLTLPTSDLV